VSAGAPDPSPPAASSARAERGPSRGLVARQCPGCRQPFVPAQPRQLHCRPSCRLEEERRRAALPLFDGR
jgi:hypothetical protein